MILQCDVFAFLHDLLKIGIMMTSIVESGSDNLFEDRLYYGLTHYSTHMMTYGT